MRLLCTLWILVFTSIAATPAFSQVGCYPLQPYLDKNGKKIKNRKECEEQKTGWGGRSTNSCWLEDKGECFWVGNPAQCTCIQKGGTICIQNDGARNEFGFCRWGSGKREVATARKIPLRCGNCTACVTWRLDDGFCKAKGYSVDVPVKDGKGYCVLLGGKVEGEQCKNYRNNTGQKENCSLNDLWHGRCIKPHRPTVPIPLKK